jgi:hypothetical protein
VSGVTLALSLQPPFFFVSARATLLRYNSAFVLPISSNVEAATQIKVLESERHKNYEADNSDCMWIGHRGEFCLGICGIG